MGGGTIARISKDSGAMGGVVPFTSEVLGFMGGPNKVHCIASGHPSAPLYQFSGVGCRVYLRLRGVRVGTAWTLTPPRN